MTPDELRGIRAHLSLEEAAFAAELGYAGTERNRAHLIREYERGKKAPIPTYIARLAWMLKEHFDCTDNSLPEWPTCCDINPPKPHPGGAR